MAERTPNKPKEPKLMDSESSEEDNVPQRYKTSAEECKYGTVPGSAAATTATLSHTTAQCNPTMEREPDRKRKTKVKKLQKEKDTDKETQTSKSKQD